jgi:hypothetical protein
VRADRLVLVDRSRKTAKIVEQEKNPVAPGFERVQPVMEAWKRLYLTEKLEVCPCDTICIVWNNLNAYRPKQVGPEGHDVVARVERLGVRVQRDGGRVVLGEGMDEHMLQTRLMVHLILETRGRPRGMIDGHTTESIVQDQRPAGGAFVVLPQPGRESVEVQKPRGLLIASTRSLIQFREELGIHCIHFGTSVPDVGAGVQNNVAKSFNFAWTLGAVKSQHKEPKYDS